MRKVLTVTYRELRATVALDDEFPSSVNLPAATAIDTDGVEVEPRPLRKASGVLRLVSGSERRSA